MKFVDDRYLVAICMSHPVRGAWIEILVNKSIAYKVYVAPHVGAWIEILRVKTSKAYGIVAPCKGA